MEHLKNLKIVSNGLVSGTKVYDQFGKDLTAALMIAEIVWRHKAGSVPTVELVLLSGHSDVEFFVPEARVAG